MSNKTLLKHNWLMRYKVQMILCEVIGASEFDFANSVRSSDDNPERSLLYFQSLTQRETERDEIRAQAITYKREILEVLKSVSDKRTAQVMREYYLDPNDGNTFDSLEYPRGSIDLNGSLSSAQVVAGLIGYDEDAEDVILRGLEEIEIPEL